MGAAVDFECFGAVLDPLHRPVKPKIAGELDVHPPQIAVFWLFDLSSNSQHMGIS